MSKTTQKPTALRRAVKGVLGTSVAVPLALTAVPGMAQSTQQEMQQMRLQMQRMQTRLNQLESRNQQMRMEMQQGQGEMQAGESENKPDKGFNVAGTNFQIGGYLKLDAIYDFDGDEGASLGPSDADLDGGTDPHTGFTAKQTRLTLSTNTPTPYGDVGGYIETDFYGDGSFSTNGSYQPRIRRAYLTYGNWLFGKDWTTFSDFNYGTMLNFYGPQAQIFERQAMIRYSAPLANGQSLDVSIENPDGQTIDLGGGATESGDEQFPDFAARYKGSAGNLSYQIAGLARYLEADKPGGGGEDNTFGYGLDAGASYSLPTGTTLMLSGNYGQGDAKYVYDPAGAADAYFDGGDLEAIERYGYIATVSQDITDQWTGNVVWGQGFSEGYDGLDSAHDHSSTLALNLLYTPVDPLTFGIEYDRAMYTTQGGDHGNADRLQFSAIYNF